MLEGIPPANLLGTIAVDRDGRRLGVVGQVYLDDRTGGPSWASVNTGIFGLGRSLTPLDGARVERDHLVLAVARADLKGAPHVDETRGRLSPSEEERLFAHYGMSNATRPRSGGAVDAGHAGRVVERGEGRRFEPRREEATEDAHRGPAWAQERRRYGR